MKKVMYLLFGIILSVGILTGCSRETLTIYEISKDLTNIEITDGTTGSIMTLGIEETDELYKKLKDLEFVKEKSSKNTTGWSYTLRFLKFNKELNRFTVMNGDTIEYKGYFYKAKNSKIDLDYLMSFFYKIFDAEIMEVGPSLLIAPSPDSDVYRSSDRIWASVQNARILDQQGNAISQDHLKPGDIIRIAFNGVVAESYPAQITTSRIELIDRNILLDGYMALIDDIYQEDSGLNGDIAMIAFDTTKWIGFSDIQKEILLSMVKEKYGLEILQGTFQELADQGLIDMENLYFEKGILIEISEMEYDADKKIIDCAISKWRSGLGAIGWHAKVKLDGTVWKVTRTNEWIS